VNTSALSAPSAVECNPQFPIRNSTFAILPPLRNPLKFRRLDQKRPATRSIVFVGSTRTHLKLNRIGFFQITHAAKQLHVPVGITASACDRDDVVKLQIGRRTALRASTAVALPNPLPNLSRNMTGIVTRNSGYPRLVCHGNRRLKDRVGHGVRLVKKSRPARVSFKLKFFP
jgi:hypothetical protein